MFLCELGKVGHLFLTSWVTIFRRFLHPAFRKKMQQWTLGSPAFFYWFPQYLKEALGSWWPFLCIAVYTDTHMYVCYQELVRLRKVICKHWTDAVKKELWLRFGMKDMVLYL